MRFAQPENFFKHADRDPENILQFALVNAGMVSLGICHQIRELTGERPLLMRAYEIWFMIHHSDILKTEKRTQVDRVGLSTDFPENDRARFFEYVLPILAKDQPLCGR
jgi:hypothetical protein